jgi:hypothetical protein
MNEVMVTSGRYRWKMTDDRWVGDNADWFQRMTTDRWRLRLALDKRRRIAARLAEVQRRTTTISERTI